MRQHPSQTQAINEYYENDMLMDEDQNLSEDELEQQDVEIHGENIMFEDQAEDVDEQYILDHYNPPQSPMKSLNISNNSGNDEGTGSTTTDDFGIPHVSINLQTASPSSYKKKPTFGTSEGSVSSTKNPYYSSPKKATTVKIGTPQQQQQDDKKRSILKENNEEEGYRNPQVIPQPSNVPTKKASPRVKFDSTQTSVMGVATASSQDMMSHEEFQKRFIERASSPPPFSVITEEKLAKLDDLEKLVSNVVEKIISEKTEEIKNFSEYLNTGVLQVMETQFNTMANVRNSPSYTFEESPQFKELLEKLEFLNAENEHLKLLLEEKELEVDSLREEAETMRQRYIMDIDKLTSEVAESRLPRRSPEPADHVKNRIERPEEEDEEEPRNYDSPKRNSPPPSRTPPPTNVSSRTPEPAMRRSIDFNSAVRSALQSMSKDQTNPLSKSFDSKQFQAESQEPQDGESSPEPMSVDRTQKKTNKTLDSITERMLRSLKGPVKAEDNAKQIDKMVGEIREQFKERGVMLPLKKVKDCVFSLGDGKTARKVHLNIINGVLKVKIGGGYDDFMKFLSQSVRLLQVKKKL
ncbi:predicted protein [Naegleria gruberi]|uniref:Predicted protein n=1 Tax=Naegleria gruberi TaxID=5762 RepID=D2VBZ2_NAEGR|nr:uncharacterized protein NAEGRDRAFT_66388 [Naegleria gruberi]EFC45565.1 predicted protein [Naegleria gruberi]|eukprot:XP_002678309.1 predicted protein [Naegleria gruberi strain NEG-M]